MERTFILIGGAPTTGKSTVAHELAHRLNLPHISTDQLRDIVKPYGDVKRHPTLYDTQDCTAEEFLTKYTPQEISDMEYKQGNDVWPAVLGILQNSSDWKDGGVIEGVNILPHLVNQEYKNKHQVKVLFLVDLNEDRIRDVVYNRGLYGNADTYSDDVKETEVEWVSIFAKRIKEEAMKHKLPCIEITKSKEDISKIIKALNI